MTSRPTVRAAALAPALAVLLALVACTDKATPPAADPTLSEAPSPAGSATGSPSATAPATPSASPAASTTPSASETMTVPVYYMGTEALLFREFRTVPRATGVVRAAVDAMLHLAPLDPDYRSLWPKATRVNGVSVDGTVATVDLSANARDRTDSGAYRNEQQSLQQLVHTVTAAAPSLTGVKLRFDGKVEPTLWGQVDTTGTLTRRSQVETLGRVWVTSPGQFATVGHRFTVKGSASVFEATVSWSIRRLSGGVIASGSTNASQGAPGRGDWTVSVTIPAGVTGEVVFKAWESSANDGSVLYPDDKRWKVG